MWRACEHRLPAARLLVALAALLVGCRWKPDVIFLTIDTLRVDHVGAFAADSPARTPNIDRLAKDGITYTQAWSPISVTGPAFCTLHTGQLPGTHGVVMNLFRGGPSLDPEAKTVARLLRRREKFHTGAFVSGFTLRKELGLNNGVGTYKGVPLGTRRIPGEKTADHLLSWLDSKGRTDQVFAWYHSYDPHGPLGVWSDPPEPGQWRDDPAERERLPEYQRVDHVTDPAWFAGEYAKAVEYADAQIGRILDRLEETGRYDGALIVFTADHGESFDERDQWFTHGNHASAEQLHVPLIVKLPKNARAGERFDGLVGLQDVAPTVHAVFGFDDVVTDGRSLLDHPGYDVIIGESSHCKDEPPLRCAPAGVHGKELAARSPTAAVVEEPVAEGVDIRVYDRAADPTERTPTGAAPDPALLAAIAPVRAARAALDLVVPTVEDDGTRSPAEQKELESLKALGYVE